MTIIYQTDEFKFIKTTGSSLTTYEIIDNRGCRLLTDFLNIIFATGRWEGKSPWDIPKLCPIFVPIMIEYGHLKKFKDGFEVDVGLWYGGIHVYYDMQMIHRITKYNNGNTYYYKYGKLHNLDGPAIYENGRKRWFVDDKDITKDVVNWLTENNYIHPFDKSTQAKFILTFG